jgi:molybdate transport system substrate-binding protein
MRTRVLALGFGAIILLAGTTSGRAAELTVLTNQGATTGMRDLAAAYEQKTGTKVIVVSLGSAEMNAKIDANAPADLASQFVDGFDGLVKKGKIVPGSWVEYVRVGNGVAVKHGAPKPDISTPEAFKEAMLDAKSIGHSNNGTGGFNTKLFQRLGIYDAIKDKIHVYNGAPVAAGVADGTFEIGLQQTNVIQPYPGTDYVGPLPPSLMEYGHIAIGLLTVSKQPEAATAFIKFATSPDAAPLLRKSTMEPPGAAAH